MEWISVKDRLPEISGYYSDRVLIYGINRGRGIGVHEIHVGLLAMTGDWFTAGNTISEATHWMPLPEKPNQ